MKPAFFEVRGGAILIYLRATPNAGRDSIEGLWEGPDGRTRLSVKVAAPPDKGKANAAVIRILSKALGAPKTAFAIITGEASRLKTVAIAGEPSTLASALKALASVN